MTPSSIARFASRSASERATAFGTATAPRGIKYFGITYPAVVGTISSTKEMETGGWNVVIKAVIRVQRTCKGFAPVDGGLITINHSGQVYRIVETKTNVPAEWVLGCIQPEA